MTTPNSIRQLKSMPAVLLIVIAASLLVIIAVAIVVVGVLTGKLFQYLMCVI